MKSKKFVYLFFHLNLFFSSLPENKRKGYLGDPIKMQLTAKDNTMFVKSQLEEVYLQINDKNEVEVKEGNGFPQLKAESENVTSSIWITKTQDGYSRQFLRTKDEQTIQVGF